MSSAGLDFAPGRLWSLWDMLKVYAHDYVRIGGKLVWSRQLFESIERRWALTMPQEDGKPEEILIETAPKSPSSEQLDDAKNSLQELEKSCRELNLVVSALLAKDAIEDLPRTAREFDVLISAFTAELKSHLFLFVPTHLAKYYELTLQSTITTRFPHASKEIVAAGNCLAAGLFTASVFHSMRAAEIGLRVLGNELGVFFPDKPLELAEWQQILEQAESKIKAMKSLQPKQHREEELNFFSQAAVQFTYFKDAWRVRVAHARETYEENPAIRVFNHTLEFFETLATRLKEPKPLV
jgi:hypothetical protein